MFIEESALTSRGKNLSVLTKLKNSLRTYLSRFSTLMLNKPQMPDTKTTFLPIDKFYMIHKIQKVTLSCESTWPHVYHDIGCFFLPTFSTHSSCNLHACFFFYFKMMLHDFLGVNICNVFANELLSGMFLQMNYYLECFCQMIDYYSGFPRIRNHFFGYSLLFLNNNLLFY